MTTPAIYDFDSIRKAIKELEDEAAEQKKQEEAKTEIKTVPYGYMWSVNTQDSGDVQAPD